MKTYTLDQVQDTLIGEKGTPERDIFEYDLQMDLIGKVKVTFKVELPNPEIGIEN